MRIDQAHSVLELACHTINHVADVTAHTSEHGQLFALGEVHSGLDLFVAVLEQQLNGHVLEVAFELAMCAFDRHELRLD